MANKDILKEDLENTDMKLINDSVMFSVFDIRDALNRVNITWEQKMSVFYILNIWKEESDNGKPKIKIRHDLFIPWVHDDYDQKDIVEAWGGGEDIEDHAIGIAGLIPIQHIQNWEEIKHYYDKEEFIKEGTEFNTLSEYYEDDGYVEFIPDELEVEWVYEETNNEKSNS